MRVVILNWLCLLIHVCQWHQQPIQLQCMLAQATQGIHVFKIEKDVANSYARSDALEEEQERWNEEWKEITARCASLHIKRS